MSKHDDDAAGDSDDALTRALAQLHDLQRQYAARQSLRTANSASAVASVRAQLSSLKLKSDIKRSSAFVKKLRMLTECNADALLRDAAELNLTRYVSECVTALADAPFKLADIAAVVKVASRLHQRYEDFAPALVRALEQSFDALYASEDKSKMLRRRLLLRLLCELYLAGVFDDVHVIARLIQRVARRESPIGVKRGKSSASSSASTSSPQLEVPLLVSFAKSVGVEFLGVQPKKWKELEKVLAKRNEPLEMGFTRWTTAVVPAGVQDECRSYLNDAFEMISKFYVAQHATVWKVEARNEKEEANRGEVTEDHVQEMKKAKLLFEKLQTSVNALADALDRDVPSLPVENKDGGSGRGELFVWEGGEGGGRESGRSGPFDDEATRSFYEDLPDLLELVPAVVLGLTEADVAELRKKRETVVDEEAETAIGIDEMEPRADDEENEIEGDGGDALKSIGINAAKDPVVDDTERDENKSKDGMDGASVPMPSLGGPTNSYHHQLDAFFASLEDLVNRDRCDKAAVEFCYRNSKANRNRLVKALYAVPRTHLELLAHYARLVATLQRVLKEDIGGELVNLLVSEFYGLIKRRNQFRLESKIKNIRFLAELVKFRICSPYTGFRCLQKCFQDFQGHNVYVATTFLENCGRFLYCSKHTHVRTVACLNVMMKLKAAKHLDPQLETLVENAYYMCKPPERVERKVKQYDPMYLYLLKVLYHDLDGSNINKVGKILRRLPWHDSNTIEMVLRAMLKVTKGKVMQMKWICEVVKAISRYHDDVLVRLVDSVLEYIRYGLEVNDYRDHQRSLGYTKLLGEMYNCGLVNMNVLDDTLYLIINHSHDLMTLPQYSSDIIGAAQLVEMKKRFLLVPDMRYDPRVPSDVDGPSEVFRIRLVSALIETCSGGGLASVSSLNERGLSRPRLSRYMIFFQRYLLSKTDVPIETDFVVSDLFDLLTTTLKDSFEKFDTWEAADRAVQTILCGDLEEAERRLSKKNTALLMATNGLESVAEGRGSISQLNDEDEDFCEDIDGDSDDGDDDDDDDDEHDDDEQVDGNDGEADDEDDDIVDGDDEDDDEEDGEGEDDEEEERLIIHDRIQKNEEDEEFEKAFRMMIHGTSDTRKPVARVNIDKMAIPTVVKTSATPTPAGSVGDLSIDAKGSPDGVVFRMLRRGNKGKVEARALVVPETSSLAQHSHRQENAGKKEQSELKRLVLQNMERDDFMSDGPSIESIPSFVAPAHTNVNQNNYGIGQQADETHLGFGGGSEWNNEEFGLRRGKGYRGIK